MDHKKKITGLFIIIVCAALACKSGKAVSEKKQESPVANVNTTTAQENTSQQPSLPKTNGTVSHRYRATGCNTVILTDKLNPQGDTLILIPVAGIAGFDTDGMKISFNYRRSMIKMPKGCEHGGPVFIWNVTKSN